MTDRRVALLCLLALAAPLSGCSDEESGGTPPAQAPLALQLPAAGTARCGTPSAGVLAQADHAFDGTVEAVTGTDVELTADSWFIGGEAEMVLITTLRGAQTTEGSPQFAPGERYLVAASGTEVMVCGYSGPWRRGLEKLYLEAFSAQD